jgi:probable rRNA maturation factor
MDDHPASESDPRIEVAVSNRQSLPLDELELADLAERTLVKEGVASGELSLSFVTADEMEDRRYLGEPGPTDVLAFPMEEDGLLGDVVVCPEVAARNRPADPRAEIRLLVVHGTLHLLGYDHERDEDRREMWARQERYSGTRLEEAP